MDDFESLIREATETAFTGWDFSYLRGRMVQEPLSWNYVDEAKAALARSTAVLDMGTGGGERLAALAEHFPPKVAATELYPPNIEAARQLLEPLGVNVAVPAHENDLPFSDAEFDLVLNRHDSLPASEISRVMMDGGEFVSQQVGGENLIGLNAALGFPTDGESWNLEIAVGQLEAAGFQIADSKEGRFKTTFTDIGAVAYYLKAVPWQVPELGMSKHLDRLRSLHQQIQSEGPLKFSYHRFFIKAVKRSD